MTDEEKAAYKLKLAPNIIFCEECEFSSPSISETYYCHVLDRYCCGNEYCSIGAKRHEKKDSET